MNHRLTIICFLLLTTILACNNIDNKPDLNSGNNYKDLISNTINRESHLARSEGLIESYFHGNNFTKIPFCSNSILYGLSNPVEVADYSRLIVDNISESRDIMDQLQMLHRLSGISAGGYGPPLSGGLLNKRNLNSFGRLDNALIALSYPVSEKGIGLKYSGGVQKQIESLPGVLQKLIIDLLFAIADGNYLLQYINNSDIPVNKIIKEEAKGIGRIDCIIKPFVAKELDSNLHKSLFYGIDMQMIAFTSRILTERVYETLRRFEDNMTDYTEIISGIEIETSMGKIGVFTENNDTIYSEYMLLIDLGGDDVYLSNTACAFGPDTPISLVIDLDGKDTYGSEIEEKNIACSFFGISMLIDRRGNDTYYSTKYGEAFSFGGMSILDDSEGDDKYISKSGYAQGSAFFGYSMLTDRGGSDTYISASYSQGFGGTSGVGLLLDHMGDDIYISQSASFCQGAAKGRWADAGDGFNMGGGHGLLIDIKGNDTYLAESFSQGASYYYGLGILNDRSGDDKYNALSHSQGSASHYTLGCMLEDDGNDKYNLDSPPESISQIIAYGRDQSAAFFIDGGGDDEYLFGNKSYGVGDIKAIGISIDMSGDDSYKWIKNSSYPGYGSFGDAQSLEETGMKISGPLAMGMRKCSLGSAMDLSGLDQYNIVSPGNEKELFFKNNIIEKKADRNMYSFRFDFKNYNK